jgi:5-methylcytosine-specific restriction endonuclease McrA
MSDKNIFISNKLGYFKRFLVHSAYWYGFAIGVGAAIKSAKDTYDSPHGIHYRFYQDEISRFTPGFMILELHWYHWYGSIRISIDLTDKAKSFMQTLSLGQIQRLNDRDYVNEFRVYDRGEPIIQDYNTHLHLVDSLEIMADSLLEGINIISSFRRCFSCNELRIVNSIADKWICESCESRYSLGSRISNKSTDNKTHKSEREKMTAKLRFQILERDNFRCKACGADPRKDDKVRLHVDHITPIALGGKTIEENLHTLCNNCNLGKGTNLTEQMSLWD